MADLSIRISAQKLGKSLENLSKEVEEGIQGAVKNLANTAYASMVAQVQASSMSPTNRQDMLRGLQFMDLGDNTYLIYLDGDWANKLEDGFGSYSIKDELLKSKKKVAVGERAGQDWVRKSKAGKKYAAVPFEHKPYAAQAGDLDSEIKKMKAFNRQGEMQDITQTFFDNFGKPIAGKVASVKNADHPFLQGLTKYQHVSESGNVSSIYMTYRMVHQDSPGWQHPGFGGFHFFDKAEQEIEKELENIVKAFL